MSDYGKLKRCRTKRKQAAIDAFGGKCGLCGYSKSKRALCFHHLDEKEKEYKPTKIINTSKSWTIVVEELRKCVMLCSNCHAEVHDGLIDIPDDIRRFDDSYSTIGIKTVKFNWSGIDVEQLYNQHGSLSAVATVLDTSPSTVHRRLVKIGFLV